MTVNHALPLLTVRADLPPVFSFPGSTRPQLPHTSCDLMPNPGEIAFHARGLQKALEDRESAEEKERERGEGGDACV